jgi:hypothetical protein
MGWEAAIGSWLMGDSGSFGGVFGHGHSCLPNYFALRITQTSLMVGTLI